MCAATLVTVWLNFMLAILFSFSVALVIGFELRNQLLVICCITSYLYGVDSMVTCAKILYEHDFSKLLQH
jgi:hypothetical protein